MIQKPRPVLRGLIRPKIICRPDDSIAFQISIIPDGTALGMRQPIVQAGPVRRSVNILLGKQILMHIKNNIDTAALGEVHNFLHPSQIRLVINSRPGLDAMPENAETQQIKPHPLKKRKCIFKIRIKMSKRRIPAEDIHAMQNHLSA